MRNSTEWKLQNLGFSWWKQSICWFAKKRMNFNLCLHQRFEYFVSEVCLQIWMRKKTFENSSGWLRWFRIMVDFATMFWYDRIWISLTIIFSAISMAVTMSIATRSITSTIMSKAIATFSIQSNTAYGRNGNDKGKQQELKN